MTVFEAIVAVVNRVEQLGEDYFVKIENDKAFPGNYWLIVTKIGIGLSSYCAFATSTIHPESIMERFENHLQRFLSSPQTPA